MLSIKESDEGSGPTKEMILGQLDFLVNHASIRSSKRLVAFLQYVVVQTLDGSADRLKERTIGIEVFDRDPDYDTSTDHIVRTAASELRKRLAVYYGDEAHRAELRIEIPSGSYVPQFTIPDVSRPAEKDQTAGVSSSTEDPKGSPEFQVGKSTRTRNWKVLAVLTAAVLISAALFILRNRETPASLFWKPLVQEHGPLLFVIGTTPQGSHIPGLDGSANGQPPSQNLASVYPTIPIADAVAMTRISSLLSTESKTANFRQDSATSFSDLQSSPTVLIGLFNNEWSLRFARSLRFSLAMDQDRQLIYIRDRQNPANRTWSVPNTAELDSQRILANGKSMTDYALISRIENSETGKVMFIIGGLYAYGTEAAGKFITDPQLENLTASIPITHSKRNLQIILQTVVIEGTPGPPKIVAFSEE
jgi:hypothetical protein